MIKHTIVATLVFAAFAMPALANEYWIVQDSSSKCSVVESNPSDATKQAPNGAISTDYQTRAAAEDAMSRMRKCGSAN
jgi:hypothetical protein